MEVEERGGAARFEATTVWRDPSVGLRHEGVSGPDAPDAVEFNGFEEKVFVGVAATAVADVQEDGDGSGCVATQKNPLLYSDNVFATLAR